MNHKLMVVAALAAATALAACSRADDTSSATDAEPAPIPMLDPARGTTGDAALPPEALALISTLSPQELAMARLSCAGPLVSARANSHIFDSELAAELKSVKVFSRTELLAKPPLNTLSVAEARAIMDASPAFTPVSQPSPEEIEGMRQCVLLAKHYAGQQD